MRLGSVTTSLSLLLAMMATFHGRASADDELENDTCERDEHCLNGGKCQAVDTFSPKHCICPEGYDGLRCEKHCPLQCANGGRCYHTSANFSNQQQQQQHPNQEIVEWENNHLPNTESHLEQEQLEKSGRNSDSRFDWDDYACHCKGLFTGLLCDIPYTNCGDMTQCFYGGTCQSDDKSTTRDDEPCKCTQGYSGRFCELVDRHDHNDPSGGLTDFPQFQQESSIAKSPWPLLLGSMGLGSVLGIAAFVWKERQRRRRLYSNWLVSNHTRDSSLSMMMEDEASPQTYINVI